MREVNLIFDVDPVSKGRPRLGKGRVYTLGKTKVFENLVADIAKINIVAHPL